MSDERWDKLYMFFFGMAVALIIAGVAASTSPDSPDGIMDQIKRTGMYEKGTRRIVGHVEEKQWPKETGK